MNIISCKNQKILNDSVAAMGACSLVRHRNKKKTMIREMVENVRDKGEREENRRCVMCAKPSRTAAFSSWLDEQQQSNDDGGCYRF